MDMSIYFLSIYPFIYWFKIDTSKSIEVQKTDKALGNGFNCELF